MASQEDVFALLIDYEWCTGCHSCELACKQINDLRADQWGIEVKEIVQKKGEKKVIDFIPIPTDLCNLCAPLTAENKLPSCALHCPPKVIEYGTVKDLSEKLGRKPKQVIWTPRASGLQKR
ncbi:MAG: oxidoreductase [Nitrososphaerales archaeon]